MTCSGSTRTSNVSFRNLGDFQMSSCKRYHCIIKFILIKTRGTSGCQAVRGTVVLSNSFENGNLKTATVVYNPKTYISYFDMNEIHMHNVPSQLNKLNLKVKRNLFKLLTWYFCDRAINWWTFSIVLGKIWRTLCLQYLTDTCILYCHLLISVKSFWIRHWKRRSRVAAGIGMIKNPHSYVPK